MCRTSRTILALFWPAAGAVTRELVGAGMRNADIARKLFLTTKTVDHHVSSILRKLGVESRSQAAAEAARLGLRSG